MNDRVTEARELARRLAVLADNKKASDIVILEMTEVLGITDYFVIATGINRRHLAAMMEDARETLAAQFGLRPLHISGDKESNWILMDYGSVIVHFMAREARTFYDLELLWGDAPRLDWGPQGTD